MRVKGESMRGGGHSEGEERESRDAEKEAFSERGEDINRFVTETMEGRRERRET